jgi:hypothetical protein
MAGMGTNEKSFASKALFKRSFTEALAALKKEFSTDQIVTLMSGGVAALHSPLHCTHCTHHCTALTHHSLFQLQPSQVLCLASTFKYRDCMCSWVTFTRFKRVSSARVPTALVDRVFENVEVG